MKSRKNKSTKWDNFKKAVINYIKENGIASMQDVYEVSNNYLHILYTTPHLEKLASFLVTECGCFRIDLSIPNPKPLSIYPNHHKISSTTFFVLEKKDDNHFEDVEKAKQILNELTQAALNLENERKKSKSKKESKTKVELNIVEEEKTFTKYRENQFRARDCMLNGFIPMTPVQLQMIHLFIFDTFGSKPFTIQELINNMSLDFMSKIVGIKHIPEVLLRDIRFQHILVSCFPERIQNQIQLSEAPEILSQNFKRMSNYAFGRFNRQFLTVVNNDMYQLIDSMKFNFMDQFEITYNFTSHDQINEFHYMLEIVDLLENIDPHSFSLWLKRFSIERKPRGEPTNITRKIVNSYISFPYHNSFPFFFPQVERFISTYGQNWCNLKASLQEIFQDEEKKKTILMQCMYPGAGPVDDFCNGRPFKPEMDTLFSKITSRDFESYKNDTNVNDPNYSNYYDPNLFFNFLSAIMKLFPSGLITFNNSMWEKAMGIFSEVTGVDAENFLRGNTPETLDYILRSKLPEYKDLCNFSTANESIKVRQFNQQNLFDTLYNYHQNEKIQIEELQRQLINDHESKEDLELKIRMIKKQYMLKSEIFELTTSDYLDRFSVKNLRYSLSRPTAEMVERLKILSLTPAEIISLNHAKIFLAEIEDIEPQLSNIDNNANNESDKENDVDPDYVNSTIVNGVLFLKLSNFLSDRYKNFHRFNQTFLRNGLNCELYTITPSIAYKYINNFFNDLVNNPYDFRSRAEINSGAVSFFLDNNMPISLILEYKGGQIPQDPNIKKKSGSKNNNLSSESDDDDLNYEDDIIIDSSYLLQKLGSQGKANGRSRSTSNLLAIVQKLRLYDSVSVKIKGFLLPKLENDSNENIEQELFKVTNSKRKRKQTQKSKSKKADDNETESDSNDSLNNKNKLAEELDLVSSFKDYPGDTSNALYTRFMQLFVVIYQACPGSDTQGFVLVCRLLYAFIDHKFSSGAPLDSILDEYASFNIAHIFSGLSFLEQFGFIYKLRSNTAMPYFLSDEFAESRMIKVNSSQKPSTDQETAEKESNASKASQKAKKNVKKKKTKKSKNYDDEDSDDSEDSTESITTTSDPLPTTDHSTFCDLIIPHIWINANGDVDQKVMHRIMRKIVEVVEFNPGIEFTELAGMIPSISPYDLFTLVDALECDEVLYSIFLIDEELDTDELEKPLFQEEVKSYPSPPIECTMYMYSLAMSMKNPLLKPAVRRNIYTTERCKFNLALVIENS